MHKSRAIINPCIIEPTAININTESGKKLTIDFYLNPNAYIENNLNNLRKHYQKELIDLLKVSFVVFPILGLFALNFVAIAIVLTVIGIFGIGVSVIIFRDTRRDLKEYENEIERGLLHPDMEKSILCYFPYPEQTQILSLWAIGTNKVLDYKFCKHKHIGNINALEYSIVDKETGNVRTLNLRISCVIQNMELEHPRITINPDKIILRIPYETN